MQIIHTSGATPSVSYTEAPRLLAWESASRIWTVLEHNQANNIRMTKEELLEETALTENQWKNGWRYCKNYMAPNGSQPVVIVPNGTRHEYVLTDNKGESLDYLLLALKGILTQIASRALGAETHEAKFGSEVHLVVKQINRLVEDADDVVGLLQSM